MKFLAHVLPLLVVVGLIYLSPIVAIVAAVIYAGYVLTNMGEKAHIGGAAKQLGSDAGWLYQSCVENASDGMLWAAKTNAEGKVAFANSGDEYAKGFTGTCKVVEEDYAGSRKEYREETIAKTVAAKASIASL